MDRRKFLGTMAGCGAASLLGPAPTAFARGLAAPAYFGLHPFIKAHPEAVFIRNTGVTSKNDADAKKREGSRLAKQIFTLRDTPGIPLTYKFAIKPNLTATSGTGLTHAIVTDPFVVEGMVESMKQMGIAAQSVYVREGLMLDLIGHYLAGHEPGNFGLFHIGKERGVSTALDPGNVPIYLWEQSGPKLTPLDRFTRTPLETPYLAKPGEAEYHLCDEPFAYAPESVSACRWGDGKPRIHVLGQWRPGRTSSSLVIEFSLPADGYASVELYNAAGERVKVLDEGWMPRGVHVATWNTGHAASGDYYCRMRAQGVDRATHVILAG